MTPLSAAICGITMLLLSGCSTIPFAPTELVATSAQTATELAARSSYSGSDALLVRQSALFRLQGMEVPIVGVMRLDPAANSARLVGMNDMGVKLYDITVHPKESTANFIIPDLAQYPGFSEAVATSVRRIFLLPKPSADDSLERTPMDYRLHRQDASGGSVRFTFGGRDIMLLEKSFKSATESWQVHYYQYKPWLGKLFPGGIVLDDDKAGYRLTIWIENVEKSDE